MRANTAKVEPTPVALHLMASGVVDQIMITDTNAAGSDIIFSLTLTHINKKATEVFCGLGNLLKTATESALTLLTTMRNTPYRAQHCARAYVDMMEYRQRFHVLDYRGMP